MAKAAFNKKRALFASTWELKFWKKLVKWYIFSTAVLVLKLDVSTVDQKHLDSLKCGAEEG